MNLRGLLTVTSIVLVAAETTRTRVDDDIQQAMQHTADFLSLKYNMSIALAYAADNQTTLSVAAGCVLCVHTLRGL